jgi:outer membrane protein insertion porin family
VETGPVYFTGNFRTTEQILRNELAVRPGEPFSAKRLLESQRNIQNMSAVDSARFRITGLQEGADTVSLFMEVEEKRPYWMEFGLGYDTERHFFASAMGGDRNLFGRNNDLRASAEISQIGYRADASFTEPRFWGTRISSTTTLFVEEREEFNQDFGTRNFGVSHIFSHRSLDNDLNLGLAFRLERREQFIRDGREIPEGDEDLYTPRTVFVTTPSAVYNTTDSFSRPTQGIHASLFVDLSTGLGDTLDNFVKYRLDTRYYVTPVEKLTFALRGRYGYIYPYGSDSVVPDDQLFYLGGTSTVRGFDENLLRFDAEGKAVGGQESLLGNVEARYDLGMNVEMAVFYDIGSVRRAEGRGGVDDFRSSVGLGFRYITPIGAVGLLYGWKLDPMEGEDTGRLHFSIGYTF